MRGKDAAVFYKFGLLTLLSGCGCGGAGGSTSLPPAAPVTAAIAPPAITSGIIAATGPLTIVNGGSVIGSTVLPTSTSAILTIDSGTTPSQMNIGGTLTTYAIRVNDDAGQSAASTTRSVRSVARIVRSRDYDMRVPDADSATATTQLLREISSKSAGAARLPFSTARSTRMRVPGDQNTFTIQTATISGANADAPATAMPATLVAQSAHANVWLDDAIAGDGPTLNREYPSGTSDFTTVAQTFEKIFTIETQAFGPAYTTGLVNFAQCDVAGNVLANAPPPPDTTGSTNPRIDIVISDALAASGEGGYFYGLDLLSQAQANCVTGLHKPRVNGRPMVVIESDNYTPYNGGVTQTYPANNEAYWLNGDMPQTLAHEFQHYLHFINKYLQQHVDHPNDPNAGTLDDSFIDEGCSVVAQDLVAGDAVGRRESPAFVRAFLLEPADFSLTSFTGYQPNTDNPSNAHAPYAYFRNTAGNYGYAYLFVRYLYDRFGPGALKAIYAETNFGNAAQPDTGPATAAAGGEPFAQLFREFTTAIAVHSGGSVAELSRDPAYRFDSSVILRGSVQTYSRRLPPYDVRTIVQPGPLNPEQFTNNVPAGIVSLSAGGSAGVSLLDGGAVFISAQQPWTQGATLRATGPIAGGGSLGQGALPTPAPADY